MPHKRVDGPSIVPHPCVPDHSVCLDLEKDFRESGIFVGRKRKQQNRIEEFTGQPSTNSDRIAVEHAATRAFLILSGGVQ